jgi:pimeloyl-ACP methyl ester carboxylesterase
MRSMTAYVVAFLSLTAAGCSSVDMHRSCIGEVCELAETAGSDAPKQCANATKTDPRKLCEKASIEHAKDFAIAYVELTDQGLFYDREQLNAALNLLQVKGEKSLEVVVFVHGWKHSAQFDDFDVINFRDKVMPALTRGRPGSRAVGIYVGWRGASLELPTLVQGITFYDRKATADHVARGSVRELFSHLQAIRKEPMAASGREVRLTLIGHSFGGLIVYNSVAESLLNSLVTANHSDPAAPRKAIPIADLVLLLNPAFEASRFEPLFQVAKDRSPSTGPFWDYAEDQRPILVSVTSEADSATSILFPLGRTVNSLFEHEGWTDQDVPRGDYSERLEKIANTHTMGHMERYRTHLLGLSDSAQQADPTTVALTCKVLPNPLTADGNRFPLWNILARKEAIDSHHDIYRQNLWDFVSRLSDPRSRLTEICR